MTDIPDRYTRRVMGKGLTFPDNDRYTLQWLVTPPETSLWVFPNNNDATVQDQTLPKPSDLLLHYNYGAAAVKQWGKNVSVLTERPGVPRPLELVPAPMGPGKTANEHLRSIKKRNAVTSKEGKGSRKRRKTLSGARDTDSDSVQHSWDEDDVVLFFWGNSKVAQERRVREEQERGRHVKEWRDAVTGSPSS
jgi:hypothetical protein